MTLAPTSLAQVDRELEQLKRFVGTLPPDVACRLPPDVRRALARFAELSAIRNSIAGFRPDEDHRHG